jgi:hypothetical protein
VAQHMAAWHSTAPRHLRPPHAGPPGSAAHPNLVEPRCLLLEELALTAEECRCAGAAGPPAGGAGRAAAAARQEGVADRWIGPPGRRRAAGWGGEQARLRPHEKWNERSTKRLPAMLLQGILHREEQHCAPSAAGRRQLPQGLCCGALPAICGRRGAQERHAGELAGHLHRNFREQRHLRAPGLPQACPRPAPGNAGRPAACLRRR